MGIPLKEGRTFEDSDWAGAEPVALVNAEAVRRFWGGRSPLGGRIRPAKPRTTSRGGASSAWWATSTTRPRGEAPPEMYYPLDQDTSYRLTFVLRTRRPWPRWRPLPGASSPRSIPAYPSSMRSRWRTGWRTRSRRRARPACCSASSPGWRCFRGRGRLRGPRLQRGPAHPGDRHQDGDRRLGPLRAVVGAPPRPDARRGSASWPGSAAPSCWASLKRLLYGVAPSDPPTALAAAAMLSGVTVAAALLPANRATRVNPQEALRAE